MIFQYTIPDSEADVRVTEHDCWTELEVVAVKGNPDKVKFLKGNSPGAWCLPMNYLAQIQVHPASGVLDATAHKKTGIVGARVAVVPAQPQIRRALKEVMVASDLWLNKLGGPWKNVPSSESYLMTLPQKCTRDTVDDWIRLCHQVRITQLDFVHSIRYGDYQPWLDLYSNGWDDVRFVTDRLRAAGIKPLLHTYSFVVEAGSELKFIDESKPHLNHRRIPTSGRLLDEIANKLAIAVERGGFDGIYFDALDYAGEIEGAEWGWYWSRRFVHEVGRRLERPDTIVETSMFGVGNWGVTSRLGSLDYKPPWREYTDTLVKAYDPANLLAPTFGWFPIDEVEDLAEISYTLEAAQAAGAGCSWRHLTPESWAVSEKIRRMGRLIAGYN